jgi:RHH-type transcriptional regulator, rel operon repressor / antitoxin RelB
MSSQPNVRIRPEIMAELDVLARGTGRSRSELAEEALAEYLDVRRAQQKGVEAAIRDADAGIFASEEEVERVFGKYREAAAADE